MTPEGRFKRKFWIPLLAKTFPGIVILDIDPTNQRSMLDQCLLYKDKWAMLDTKSGGKASKQPNQGYYVDLLGNMSYANFVHPGNWKEVLNDLEQLFRPNGETQLSLTE